jgi:DNA-binding MarR family transcriptional regulator
MSTAFLGPDGEPEPRSGVEPGSTDPSYEGDATAEPRPLVSRMRTFALESSFYLSAVADRLGMSATDFTCLTLLLTRGPLSAGALAEQTGLTSGAITGLVDRLEQAGWVKRGPDPADRRRVIVQPLRERLASMRPLLDPMLADTARVEERFDDAQMVAILTFIEESTAVLARQVQLLRDPSPAAPAVDAPGTATPGAARVLREGRTEAQLVLRGIASDVTVSMADLGDVLCVADFGRRGANLAAKGGRVEIGRGGWTRGITEAGRVTLHRDVRWDVAIRGGASRLAVDLRGGRVSSVVISGGANVVELDLPEPDGLVPVRLQGGVSHVRVTRPAGVPITPHLRGGSTNMEIDGVAVRGYGRVIGTLPNHEHGYDIEVKGGASSVEVTVAPASSRDRR